MNFCKLVFCGLRCWLEEGHESIYETREHQYRIEGWRIGTPASKEYANKLVSQGKIKIS